MANICNLKTNYSKKDYADLAFDWELAKYDSENGDTFLLEAFKENIKTLYSPNVAQAIIAAIDDGSFGEAWDYLPMDSPISVDSQVNINGAKSATESPNELDGFYINSERSTTRRDNMTKRFFEEVVTRTVYDKKSGSYFNPSTNFVNNALYQYKLELLRNLWNFTGVSHENEMSPDDFGMVLSKTFAEYLQNKNTPGYDDVYDDYVILKRFNKLIRDFTPFIKVDAAFARTEQHAKDMYVYDPSGTYRQSWTDSEDASIEKSASSLVKLLAGYFTTHTAKGIDLGVSIGFMTYNRTMSTMFRWIQENRLDGNVLKLREDIRNNGVNADFGHIIDEYIARANELTDNEKQILWGIKKQIFDKYSRIPKLIKYAFANQAFLQAKYAYIAYRQNYEDGDTHIRAQYLEDSFIDTRSRSLHNMIQSKVWIFQQHSDIFESLCQDHGITVEDENNGTIRVTFDSSWGDKSFSAIVRSSNLQDNNSIKIEFTSELNPDFINEEKVKDAISDFLNRLIGDDYKDIIHAISSGLKFDVNLFDIFIDPIVIICAAVKDNINGQSKSGLFKYDENGFLRTYAFKDKLSTAIQYASIADGINELNVLTNGEGNKLPIYQLAPAIFDIFDVIDDLTDPNNGSMHLQSIINEKMETLKKGDNLELKNVLEDNSFIKNKRLLKKIVSRSDVKIGNTVKSADKLTEGEVAQLSFIDFYQNLHATDGDLAGCIVLQPIVYSDKKTHFLPVLDVENDFIGGKTVAEILRSISNPNSTDKVSSIKLISDRISQLRANKTRRQIYNQYVRFNEVINKSRYYKEALRAGTTEFADNTLPYPTKNSGKGFNAEKVFYNIAKVIENINAISKTKNVSPLEFIRTLFKDAGTALNEDFDFAIVNNELQANDTLAFNLRTYLSKENNFDNYAKEQKARLASDLLSSGVSLDIYLHPELKSYFETFGTDIKSLWIDPYSGIMKLYRVFDSNGQEVYPTLDQVDSGILYNPDANLTIELNPMIEGLFYANMLYSIQFDEILFGGTEGYSAKAVSRVTDFRTADLSILGQITASRLSNEFKRTTFAGSVKRKYAQGLQFGVSKKARFAVVDDDEPEISTLRGNNTKQVAQDGSGWVNPLMARMIQKSLLDSPVGDVRKTIAGWMDPRFGTQIHFKWAETTITADLRQKAQGDGSAEVMYRKSMQAIDIHDKFKRMNLNMNMYYNVRANAEEYKVGEEIITTTKPIFRYDLETGTYYKLMTIEKNGDTLTAQWAKIDKNKNVDRNSPILPINTIVRTLYDLDQAFGGAFVYELDENDDMQISEGVHDILYHMICHNDMKEDFIGYIVNRSACKAGAINVNSYDTLKNNDSKLRSHYISTAGFGIQMDADHDMNFADVTEMSQMISLLTQSGHNVEIVNRAYADIGRVAAKAMNDILAAVDTEAIKNKNQDKIYAIIGKALLDTFESATKEELGLAQAFIRTAQNAILNEVGLENVILPYSSESIKGAFVTAVMALINKTGIKRKYAGFGGVQVPADKTMQHYDFMIRGERVAFDYRGMRDYIRPTLQKEGITFEQAISSTIINGKPNPFLEAIDPKDVRFEDTIMYRAEGDNGEGTVLKLNTFKEFDKVRNLLGPEFKVYRWTIKPRELAQNDLRIETSDGTISEYDLDAVRASFYLSELIAYKKGESNDWLENTNRKRNVIRAAIQQSDLPNDIIVDNIFKESVEFLTQCKKLLITKAQNYMNDLNLIVNSEAAGELPIQMSQIGDNILESGKTTIVSPNIQNVTAQVVIGRRNFEKFGLKRGDKLYDIKRKGAKFFHDRLKQENSKIKLDPGIPKTRYDAVLRLGNNDKVLVIVGDQDINFNYFGQNQEFRVSDNAVSYKGKVIFDDEKLGIKVKDLLYMSYISPDGSTIPVVWVPDWDILDTIATSDAVKNYAYNYNAFNVESLLKHTHAEAFDENGNQFRPIEINGEKIWINNLLSENAGENGNALNSAIDTFARLNQSQYTFSEKALWRKATILYRNFMHQLHMIQTRIPSQAMQSTMNIEVVDFADTDTNYIWVNKKIFKLQGSDLDIDKAYCMAYDVDDAGNIQTLSDLIKFTDTMQDEKGTTIYLPKYSVDDVLLLENPNKKIITDKDAASTVDFTDTFNALKAKKARRAAFLNELLKAVNTQGEKRINVIVNGLNEDDKLLLDDLIKDANIHNKSRRSKSEVEGALRNRVLASARMIMNRPASQLDAETPIDLKEPKAAAELSIIGNKEKYMTLDNFMSIYIMQKQFMAGKQVIAMSATGIKSYFIVTTYYNTLAKQLEGFLHDYIEVIKRNNTGLVDPRTTAEARRIGDQIVAILNEITFDGKFGTSSENPILRTFANVNFYEIKKAISKNKELLSQIYFGNNYSEEKYNTAFKKYANNYDKTLDLAQIVEDLDKVANGNTWVLEPIKGKPGEYYWEYFKVNAPDSLSALLSAATDNAKELILEKLNASVQFADLYVTLISHGVRFMDIAKVLTNKAFGIVAKFAIPNIFDKNTNWFNTVNAINFVLNEKHLPVLPSKLFESFITNVGINNSSTQKYNGFLYDLLELDNVVFDAKGRDVATSIRQYIYDQFVKESKLKDSDILDIAKKSGVLVMGAEPNTKLLIRGLMGSSNTNKNIIAKIVSNLFNNINNFMEIDGVRVSIASFVQAKLLNTLKQAIERHRTDTKEKPLGAEDVSYSEEEIYDPTEALLDQIDNPEEYAELISYSKTKSDDSWYTSPFTLKDLTNIYRYVNRFFIPKNELWNALSDDEKVAAQENLKVIRDDVIYAAQEMKMLGVEASINQGMKVRSFDEVNKILQLESFVNNAYINRGTWTDDNPVEEFNLITFLNDPEYRERQIEYYNKVKSSINILKAIQVTGNFKEMFQYIGVARKIIEKSAAIRLERTFVKDILRLCSKTDKKSGINLGATKKISQADFKIVSRYVRDLIAINFFANQGNSIKFSIPKGQSYYDHQTGIFQSKSNSELTRTMNNIHNIATFKHLMDHYIIPMLQKDSRFRTNRFIKNLALDRGIDPKTRTPIISYKLQDSITDLKNPKAKDTYDGILEDFNKILYMPIDGVDTDGNKINYGIGNWTIGNLFFIYNLLVDKDRISGNAITKLFADLVSSNNTASLPYAYNKYLSDLDKRVINIYNEDGTINRAAFAYDISDLQYRLSDSQSASKYGVKERKIGRIVDSVDIKPDADSNYENFITEKDINKLSDYPFDMRFLTNLEITSQVEHISDITKYESFEADDATVFRAVVEELSDTYGKEIPVMIFEDSDIDVEFSDLTDDQRDAMKNARGFIMNGNIYINGKTVSTSSNNTKREKAYAWEAPMHEMMHFVCAIMKFNSDSNIREQYYGWLNTIESWINGKFKPEQGTGNRTSILNDTSLDGLLGEELKMRLIERAGIYGNKHTSDLAEEILVTLLGKIFANKFKLVWGDQRNMTPQFIQANVKNALAKVFKNNDIKALPNENLPDIPLMEIVQKYASQLLSTDSLLLDMAINSNQELADLKDLLIKKGYITLSEECL